MINDIEFVGQYSAELGTEYHSAKRYVREMPSQALLLVRSLCHRLVQQLGDEQALRFSSPNLYDRVEQLNQLKVISPRQTRLLHKLRVQGNKGAHPEKYHLTFTQLILLAEKAITDILSLIASLKAVEQDKSYHFEPFDDMVGRDICYKAVMESDPHAQYLVGLSLKTKGLMLLEQEMASDTESGEAQKALRQAAYWFEQASHAEAGALFEHGVALIHGYAGQAQVREGEKVVARAAEAGDIEAAALLGYFYLSGSQVFEVDLDEAFLLLSLAAKHDHPEAMANLGVYHYQLNDEKSAFSWISKAAQAGNPHSQYHLALMLESGEGGQTDLQQSLAWFQEAADQGQLDAMLAMARKILAQEVLNETESAKVQGYLSEVIKYARSVPAMLELSVALADGILGRIDVVGAAELLSKAKLYGNEQELAVITPLWESMLVQVNQVIELTQSEEELATLKQALKILEA